VEDRLFATLDTLTREVDLGEGMRARVTDTVGFIRKLPHHLVASFRATLEEVREADLLLHVVDASSPDWREQVEVVDGVLAELGVQDVECWHLFNKMDAVPDARALVDSVQHEYPDAVFTTTVRTDGLVTLKRRLREQARRGIPTVVVTLAPGDGAGLAELYRLGDVVDRVDEEEGTRLTVRLALWQVERLRERGLSVDTIGHQDEGGENGDDRPGTPGTR